jgi:AraC-like DNA-binding protein
MKPAVIERQKRLMIAPQLLFHAHRELSDRGVDLSRDPEWRIFDAEGRLPNHQRLSYLHSQNLLMRALDLSGDPDLGLAVGYRQTFASFGLISAAMMTSATLRDAVTVALRFHAIIGSMLDFDAALSPDGTLTIAMHSRFAGSPIRRLLMQEALVLILTAARFLASGENPVMNVMTPFRPQDHRRFAAHCGCPVSYSGDRQTITLSSASLARPNPLADPFANTETLAALEKLFATVQEESDFLYAIEARIMRSLPKVESLAVVAAAFGQSERSLRRRLEESGTTYRDILHDIRLARARQRLSEGRMTRDQIAFELGFEDARSLRRLLEQGIAIE